MKAYEGLTRTGQIRRLAVAARDALAARGLESAPLHVVHHFHNTTFKVGHDYAYLELARADQFWAAFLEGDASRRRLPAGLDQHLDGLVAGRRVLVALWLAGNLGQPSFAEAPTWIEREIDELRRILRDKCH